MIDWAVRSVHHLWHQATAVYGVNPAVFVGLYLFSFLPFYYGVFRILRGAKRRSLNEAASGFAVNRFAWALPYLYVLVFGKNLPTLVTVLVLVWVIGSTAWMGLQLRNQSYRAKWEARLTKAAKWLPGRDKPIRVSDEVSS